MKLAHKQAIMWETIKANPSVKLEQMRYLSQSCIQFTRDTVELFDLIGVIDVRRSKDNKILEVRRKTLIVPTEEQLRETPRIPEVPDRCIIPGTLQEVPYFEKDDQGDTSDENPVSK